MGRDGEQFWVGPIDVSCQKKQPAPVVGSGEGEQFDQKKIELHNSLDYHVFMPSTPVVAWPKLITSWKDAA